MTSGPTPYKMPINKSQLKWSRSNPICDAVCRRASLVIPNFLEILESEPIKLSYWDAFFFFYYFFIKELYCSSVNKIFEYVRTSNLKLWKGYEMKVKVNRGSRVLDFFFFNLKERFRFFFFSLWIMNFSWIAVRKWCKSRYEEQRVFIVFLFLFELGFIYSNTLN